ncbi:23S rRNA (guanosine(2251)-2'-O)-methyltransferase RlmB [Sneathiella glossodoripedis]|uniref:23S rRNA (guanosine(2251)-2'-O)-methyltransferase RlmB n=1 Tax=Sneathiella glossodoripedis TaxID=418853 RepID=UPI000A02C27D|nr:23S rRNA (guanosine(2251)-2'-O)-methyltransferase RlmB [Sneathiella glossodoripedis]
MTTRKTPKGQKSNFFSSARKSGERRQRTPRNTLQSAPGDGWLYGDHAVLAALTNPNRKIKRLLITKSKETQLSAEDLKAVSSTPNLEYVSTDELNDMLPEGAIHQGIALKATPLPDYSLEDIPNLFEGKTHQAIAVLDQVTDPHNVGAITRSAAAFGIGAIVLPDRRSPSITGVLARSASGAIESVPLIRVNNLARALDKLAEMGFWRIGMDGRADQELETAITGANRIALVLGSEGKGLRRLTEEKCDLLGKLPISSKIESLNVSNAAAIAFYEIAKTAAKG